MRKTEIFSWVIDHYCKAPITVLEVGRLRDIRPQYREGDGWSTLQFARNPKVAIVYSVDNDPKTLAACSQFPELAPETNQGKIVYAEKVEDINPPPITFLYLDAENDAEAMAGHWQATKGFLAKNAVVLVDDVYSPEGKKGDILIPMLEKEGYEIQQIYPMALAIKKNGGG